MSNNVSTIGFGDNFTKNTNSFTFSNTSISSTFFLLFSRMQHGNTAVHEAARWRHPSIVQLLMHSDCRINMRNSQGETPMEIARRERYNDIIAQLSGLGNCNLHEQSSQLREILFQNKESLKSEDIKKLKLTCQDGEKHLENDYESSVFQTEYLWKERLDAARTEIMARYESRIAEVEQQCKLRVAQIERQCSERLQAARVALSDVVQVERVPSAPVSFRRPLFRPSASIETSDSY